MLRLRPCESSKESYMDKSKSAGVALSQIERNFGGSDHEVARTTIMV